MMPVSPTEHMINLFLLAGPEAPTLKELMDLPAGMSVAGIGRPNKECAGELSDCYISDAVQLVFSRARQAALASKAQAGDMLQAGLISSGHRSTLSLGREQASHRLRKRSSRFNLFISS